MPRKPRGGTTGRPKIGPARELRLTPEQWQWLEDTYGKAQKGLRELVKQAMEGDAKPPE